MIQANNFSWSIISVKLPALEFVTIKFAAERTIESNPEKKKKEKIDEPKE